MTSVDSSVALSVFEVENSVQNNLVVGAVGSRFQVYN